jgi:hypothetical protein
MNYGLLLNAGISLLIAAAGGSMAITVFIRRRDPRIRPISFSFAAFWACITMVYLLASLRILAAFFGNSGLDRLFYQIDNAFGGAMVMPSVFLAFYLLTRNRVAGTVSAVVMGVVWVVWLVVMYTYGVVGPEVSRWHTDWAQANELAEQIAIFGLYLPTVLSMIAMFFGLLRVDSPTAKYRLAMTATSMIITVTLVVVEFLTTNPLAGIWIRSGILAAVLVGVLAYFPPGFIRSRLQREKLSL